jgi:hypothetical protein
MSSRDDEVEEIKLLPFTDLFAWSAFVLALSGAGVTTVFVCAITLQNNFYSGDPLASSGYALCMSFFLMPFIVVAAFTDALSRVGEEPHMPGTSTPSGYKHSGDQLSDGRARQTIVALISTFLTCASVAALIIFVVMASYRCTTQHAQTACKSPSNRELRWQHVTALIVTGVASLFMAIFLRALFRFKTNLFRTRRILVANTTAKTASTTPGVNQAARDLLRKRRAAPN